MKTKLIIATLLLSGGLLLTTTGCDKVKGKLFKAFTTGSTTVDFNIPIINDTNAKSDWGTVKQTINIDSLIKSESGGVFSIKDIKSVKISEMKLTITNGDLNNNFANFQQGWGNFNSNTKPTVIEINTGLNPDVYSDMWILPSVSGINLKDYVSATEFNYILAAKARRPTNKILNAKLAVKFLIE